MIATIAATILIKSIPTVPLTMEREGHVWGHGLFCLHQDDTKPKLSPQEQKQLDKKAKDLARFEAEIQDDKRIGKEAADFYDRQYPPIKNPDLQKRVEDIGSVLATIANANPFETIWGDKRHAEFEYKFRVVENEDVNAFSLPGGYIYVHKGLIEFCQSDDELAGVLAHEICHASQRHLATLRKEQEKLSAIQIPLILVSVLTGGAGAAAGAAGAGGLVSTAITNGWSQKAEQSADYGGFQLMVAAGYDATGLITFMERLQLQQSLLERAVDMGIYRTHPPSKVRAQSIEGYMKKNLMPVRRSKVTTAFRVSVRQEIGHPTLYFGAKKMFSIGGDGAAERASSYSKTLNDFFDKVPEMFEVTLGGEGEIFGKNRLLFKLHESDAQVNGVALDKLQTDVSKQIRSAIFTLAYHIWEGRG
jgi:beta-barrel assembly-enhancing protease